MSLSCIRKASQRRLLPSSFYSYISSYSSFYSYFSSIPLTRQQPPYHSHRHISSSSSTTNSRAKKDVVEKALDLKNFLQKNPDNNNSNSSRSSTNVQIDHSHSHSHSSHSHKEKDRPIIAPIQPYSDDADVDADGGDGYSFDLPSAKLDSNSNSNSSSNSNNSPKSFYIETYGCQMNVNDSEIVRSILLEHGLVKTDDVETADLILANTCAIRENAEQKVWNRLHYFNSLKEKHKQAAKRKQKQEGVGAGSSSKKGTFATTTTGGPVVGVLGCMAERLKEKLLEEESVDFVCGPDSYRDIPRLIKKVSSTDQKEANTRLSLDETYADISPVRASDSCSAFVSIMRGCNNMCSYCIVPFTRGRERSRDVESIVREIRSLVDQGVKEIVLLGQNVNGFHDTSKASAEKYPPRPYTVTNSGFKNIFNSKSRDKPGARFVDLLDEVSSIDPEVRIRFTSPHPKDFPEEVLSLIAERPNLCSSLHLPFQSGSSSVLDRMRRGYSREAFIDLVNQARALIPGVSISADVIAGFCGETEEEHKDTVSLMEAIKLDQAYTFAYSMRERTHAFYQMKDDVPEDVKSRRLSEIIEVFHRNVHAKTSAEELGQYRLVLVEGFAKKSSDTAPLLSGRTGHNKRILFPASALLFSSMGQYEAAATAAACNQDDVLTLSHYFDKMIGENSKKLVNKHGNLKLFNKVDLSFNELVKSNRITEFSEDKASTDHKDVYAMGKLFESNLQTRWLSSSSSAEEEKEQVVSAVATPRDYVGRYVAVRVLKVNSATLRGVPVAFSSIAEFSKLKYVM